MTEKKPLREQMAAYSYKQQEELDQRQQTDKILAYTESSSRASRHQGSFLAEHLSEADSFPSDDAKRRGASLVSDGLSRRNDSSVGARNKEWATPRTQRRVSTVPAADPSAAWNTFSQRQEERRRSRARPVHYTEMVPRTYAQTGMRASSGRIPAVRRLPQYTDNAPPIPVRSGRTASRRGLFWRIVAFLFGIVAIVLALTFAFTSNAFRVEQINVAGTHNKALIDAIQRMGMQGQNIFLINVAAFNDQVESYPVVASASLSKQWPNQLQVTVVERQPVLLWQTKQGTYSVDNQGVVIALARDTVGADHLLTVVDTRSLGQAKSATIHPGTHLNAVDVAFAVTVFNRLPQLGVSNFKLRFDANTQGKAGGTSYVIESPDGWKAYLGDAQDTNPLDNRLRELRTVLTMAQQQQITLATVDVRYGLHPVYTIK